MPNSCVVLSNGHYAQNGSRLADPLLEVDAASMGAAGEKGFTVPVYVIGRCSSTFDVAWELGTTTNLSAWSAVIAHCQYEGRGQVRREWHSPPGNLYVSFFLPQDMERFGDLAAHVTGYLVNAALKNMGLSVSLKWPNDILLLSADGTEGKLGGLLLEERQGRLLAGLGLNLRSAPGFEGMRDKSAVQAASLDFFTGSVCSFWKKLLHGMQAHHAMSIANGSIDKVRRAVESALAWKDREIYAEDEGISGKLDGIAPDGALLLRTATGIAKVISGSIRPVR